MPKSHKKCTNIDGCGLIASFGFNKKEGTKFCSKHKEAGMINLLCKLCSCGKARPTFNIEGLTSNFCKDCKTSDMVNVNDIRCFCGKSRPTFNVSGLKPMYCAKCKTSDMIDIYCNRCVGCNKNNSNFNYEGLKPKYCSKCCLPDMVDLTHQKCKCGKVQPSFNYKGLKPEYCSSCKLPDMIILRKRLCIKCDKGQATFNFFGEKARFCSQCKEPEMINIIDKCKNKDCTNCGNIKYRYYCTHCFSNLFPNDPLVFQIRIKSKENYVRDFLNENFDGFIHDVPLWTGNCDCSHRRRIDHRKLIGNTLLCVETDEYQHKRYNAADEEIRYDDLYLIHSGKFIFIRFNPDKYINSDGKQMDTPIKKRMPDLQAEVNKQIARILDEENNELLEIVHLFFDGYK